MLQGLLEMPRSVQTIPAIEYQGMLEAILEGVLHGHAFFVA